jgi:hypothetical protein
MEFQRERLLAAALPFEANPGISPSG